MDLPTNPRSILRDNKNGGTAQRSVSPCVRQGTKLRDMLMSDKPNLSYAHYHHEITRDMDDILPKHLGSQKNPVSDKMTLKKDEVVRYMSNLPSYLENGKNYQEKALNVGVIDWKHLEKWHYSKKQMPNKYMGYSPSSCSTSSYKADGSSSHSYSSQSHSPSRQKMPSFSQKSPPESSLQERDVQDVKSFAIKGQNCSLSHQKLHHSVLQSDSQKVYAKGGKSEDIDIFGGKTRGDSTSSTGNLGRKAKVLGAYQEYERKQSTSKSVSAIVHPLILDTCEVAAHQKGKIKIQGNESAKETLRLRETKLNAAYGDYSKREKSGIIINLKDQTENSYSDGVISDSTMSDQSPVQLGRNFFLGKNKGEDPSYSKNDNRRYLETTGSRPWDAEAVKNSSQASSLHHTKLIQSPSQISTQGAKAPSQGSYLLPFPARRFSSPSRTRNTEEKRPIAGLRVVNAAKSLEEFDARKSSESIPKARNPSPIRRLSFAMSRMIKSAGSRENSPLHRSSSTDGAAKYGSEGATSSVSTDQTCSERPSSNNRGRSSPLRRLLDPLLKSRGSNNPEPSKKHSSSTATKARYASGSKTSSSDLHPDSKKGSSSLQALLQVSFKNGLPLFTFAIDNESNILAATVRKSYVPGKGHYTWTYTFFTVHEVKRKSGIWLNHEGRSNGHGYVPNVVAQMKVSDSQGSPFIKHEKADDDITREFDLFAVDVAHGDQHATDFHPTNELAAIIVKLPRVSPGNLCKGGESTYSWLDLSLAFVRENFPEMISCNSSINNVQNFQNVKSPNFSTTVVLPGGVHTIPSRGEISTLAHRWRSGGSCDCGGWDLGCQLRVYTNQIRHERKMGSSGTCLNEHKFQLFSQVGQDNQLMLSLAPFKERIYSVDFSSSLSLLQAFAICISFVDCRRPAELSGPSIVVEKISNEVGVFEVPVHSKTSSNQAEVKVPARYVSYPPHSPVGRV